MDKQTVQERFWSKVRMSTRDVCWNWTFSVDKKGYGRFYFPGNIAAKAHRVAALFSNIIQCLHAKDWVLHTCDNPSCVNPYHLYAGTAKQNQQDTVLRNRRPKSNKSSHSEVVKDQVVALYQQGIGGSEISRQLGVQKSFVFSLLKRKGLR